MLAEYTIKFTLDNSEIFNIGMLAGGVIGILSTFFVLWYLK